MFFIISNDKCKLTQVNLDAVWSNATNKILSSLFSYYRQKFKKRKFNLSYHHGNDMAIEIVDGTFSCRGCSYDPSGIRYKSEYVAICMYNNQALLKSFNHIIKCANNEMRSQRTTLEITDLMFCAMSLLLETTWKYSG
eukprot:228372_1